MKGVVGRWCRGVGIAFWKGQGAPVSYRSIAFPCHCLLSPSTLLALPSTTLLALLPLPFTPRAPDLPCRPCSTASFLRPFPQPRLGGNPPNHWPHHPTTTHCPLHHHRMPTPSWSARSAAAWRRVTTGWCTRLSWGARSWTTRHQRQCTTARLATTTERGMAKAWSPDFTTACGVFVGCWRGICRLF